MKEYIVEVNYFPHVMGKNKLIKVKSDKSVDNILDELHKIEKLNNPMFEVDLYLYSKEEFLENLEEICIKKKRLY